MYQHIKLLVKGQGMKLKVPLLLFMLLCLLLKVVQTALAHVAWQHVGLGFRVYKPYFLYPYFL